MNFDKFFSGYELEAWKLLGAHKKDGGVEFAVWAPHASAVELMTSRDWEKTIPLSKIDERGIWYVFVENMECIYSYRYRIHNGKKVYEKSDPYAYYFERRPSNASCMYDLDYFSFSDDIYMSKRKVDYDAPMNIYEVHLNGFKKEGEFATYRELKETLIPYVKKNGFTHIELLPVFEHPFDGSWGYQASGFFAATSRYGTPYDLMDLINECHNNDIGVILDAVYVHFVTDEWSLKKFDGSYCYERNANKSEWDTYYFDFSKPEVISFVMSSANFFLKRYHADGLRFDAVSHFVYKDGNSDKGNNVDGINFLKRMNFHLKKENPDIYLIAEDSTAFEGVTKPVEYGGLGFDYKWDLGWMNDTLKYYEMDPVYRSYHHHQITFSMAYFYSERFLLPFSHDEVVHSKRTIIDKMWGSYEDKFKQVRNLYVYMFTHPGKKLNFMGNEIAMFREFDEKEEMDWFMLKYPAHDSFARLFRDLSLTYKAHPCLYKGDYNGNYYRWIDADNTSQSIYSYYRYDNDECLVTILNMTPCEYRNYRIGVPFAGIYEEMINSEKDIYGGVNMCNYKPIKSVRRKAHGLDQSIRITIAPFAAIVFRVDLKKYATHNINDVKTLEAHI